MLHFLCCLLSREFEREKRDTEREIQNEGEREEENWRKIEVKISIT